MPTVNSTAHLLQELPGVTQLQAVKDSYVPVIKFQVLVFHLHCLAWHLCALSILWVCGTEPAYTKYFTLQWHASIQQRASSINMTMLPPSLLQH